jgi:hypothetical protein
MHPIKNKNKKQKNNFYDDGDALEEKKLNKQM